MTFVFTDVEGSTALLRRLGARAYAGVLNDHDAILRDVVAANGGTVVDTQGDAMFAAFPEASRAVAAAVSAQRALAGRSWPEGEVLRVRMGLHLGEPEVSGGRYLGLDVHLAARICAAAHGGQIVISSPVAARTHTWPEGTSPRSLGEHFLKDFDAAQTLHQVDWQGQAPAFPPLRTGAVGRDMGRFEGREDQLATAAAAAIAAAARRSERRRVLAVVGVVAVIGALIAAYVLTRPTPVAVRGNSIAVLDAGTGKVVADVRLSSTPTALAAGAGAVWTVSGGQSTLTRISERTLATHVSAVGSGAKGPTDVGVGFGHVWVVNGLDRSMTLVSPRGTVQSNPVALPKGLGVLGIGDAHIAVGSSAVWVDNGGAAGVTRFTPTTLRSKTTKAVPTGAIAAGAGAVWVGAAQGYFGSGTVVQLDPATGRAIATFGVGGVDGLAAGLGHCWVANAGAGIVERLDPVSVPSSGGQPVTTTVVSGTVGSSINVGRGVDAVAVGDGRLWAANPLTGTVTEIDPARGRIIRRIPVDGRPFKLVASGGRVWVAVLPRPPSPSPGGVTIALAAGDIDSVDPAVASYATTWQMEYATGLNLVRYADAGGPAGLRIVPDAAAALPQVSNHGRTFTFRLRRGLRFSPPSNQRVTARTFQYTLERQLRVGSPLGSFLRYEVVGAARYLNGKTQHISGIRVRRDMISITRPRNPELIDLLSLLALPYSSAVPINWAGPSPGGGAVPSAGPYDIRFYTPNDQLILARNPNYHGPRRGRIGEFTFVESEHPWALVQHHHAAYSPDAAPPRPAELATQIRRYGPNSPAARAGHQQVFVDPTQAILYLIINTRVAPFTNPLVRRAINEAIDRPALAATYGPGGATVTDQYLTPSLPGFPGNGHAYPLGGPDLPAAHELMRKAGVRTPIRATLYTSGDDPTAVARVAIIARDLRRIGIVVAAHAAPRATLVQEEDHPVPYPLIDDNHLFPVADPGEFLDGSAANWGEGPFAARFVDANDLRAPRRSRVFGHLDLALARDYAPLAAYGYLNHIDEFGGTLAGQTYEPVFGIDLTRLHRRR